MFLVERQERQAKGGTFTMGAGVAQICKGILFRLETPALGFSHGFALLLENYGCIK